MTRITAKSLKEVKEDALGLFIGGWIFAVTSLGAIVEWRYLVTALPLSILCFAVSYLFYRKYKRLKQVMARKE